MANSPRNLADHGLDDPLAWIARALRRFAQDPGCRACIVLAREGLAHVLASLGASGRRDAAVELCAEILASAVNFEEGRRDWNAESVMVLAQGVEEIQARVGESAEEGSFHAFGTESADLHSVLPVIPLPMVGGEGRGSAVDASGSTLRPLPVTLIDVPERAFPSSPPRPDREAGGEAGSSPAPSTSGRADRKPRDRPLIAFDPVRLDAVLEDPGRPPSERVVERLSRTIDGIGIARERWPANLEGRPVPAGLRARLEVLSRDAAEGGALRLAEFARALADFLRERDGDVDGLRAEHVQVLGDGLEVLPVLLAEIRSGAMPATPVLDILLRAQSSNSGVESEEEPVSAVALPDEADLERIRRQGRQELERLAAAFAAVEGGSSGADDEEPAVGAGSPVANSTTLRELDRIDADQQRIMAALGLAGSALQAIERLGSALSAQRDAGAAGGVNAGDVEELEQARRAIGGALGAISDVVLDQRRWLAERRDRAEPPCT